MSDIETRSIKVKKYFTKTPNKPSHTVNWVIMSLGLFIFISPFFSDDPGCYGFCFGFGVLILIAGGLKYRSDERMYKRAYDDAEPKPSDQQLDEWLEEAKQEIISGAMDKLHLTPEQALNTNDPLVVIGPSASAKFKVGEDGVIRFSSYKIVVIYLSQYHLGAYTCNLRMDSGEVSSEQTQEYHYADIVSVSTLTSNSIFKVITMDGREHDIKGQQQFSLSVVNGESITVTVAFPELENIFSKGRLLPTGADKAINTIRKMWLEQKGSSQSK